MKPDTDIPLFDSKPTAKLMIRAMLTGVGAVAIFTEMLTIAYALPSADSQPHPDSVTLTGESLRMTEDRSISKDFSPTTSISAPNSLNNNLSIKSKPSGFKFLENIKIDSGKSDVDANQIVNFQYQLNGK
ncbi:hypothetical protein [Iningainema tapete]|uniref:Uncharacterized protein n=1 Tax=Iningainema tapete BLCC-T55 TaxID=2748662 RepID=A0A8J6XLA3_9CYAN|nr:hypothetical protein [Iningainema tapete]MBD2776843.1 hypothetical protein [Iningainema tapete BLCC-T55]